MDMHITGLGPLSSELSSVRGWIRGAVRAQAQPAIDAQLQHELRTALAELPLTELIREAQGS